MNADALFRKISLHHHKLRKEAEKFNLDDQRVKWFSPFLDGFRLSSRWCLVYDLHLNLRRVILLYVAMFIDELAFVQLQVFMITSLLSLVYLVYVR